MEVDDPSGQIYRNCENRTLIMICFLIFKNRHSPANFTVRYSTGGKVIPLHLSFGSQGGFVSQQWTEAEVSAQMTHLTGIPYAGFRLDLEK